MRALLLTPFQLLVSVVLSAQTTDKIVNRVMNTISWWLRGGRYLEMGADGLLEKIRQIGLAPTKSKNVYKLALSLKKTQLWGSFWWEPEALAGVGENS